MSAESRRGGRRPPAKRDTPVDVPAVRVSADASLTERPEVLPAAAHGTLETLEAAYAVWAEERARHAAALLRHTEERRRIEDEASFVVGAVRAASGAPVPDTPGALVAPTELSRFVAEAEQKIAEARAQLQARVDTDSREFERRFAALRLTIRERLSRFAAASRPAVRVVPRRLAADRRIVHVERVGADEALLLLHLLTQRIASRYGFLEDDATDDVRLPPPPLYADEGVTQVRVGAAELDRLIREAPEVLPIKGFLPLHVPLGEGTFAFYRLLQRGPVLELELAEGEGFRNLLTREEAERAAGHLIRLKLAGKIELSISAE